MSRLSTIDAFWTNAEAEGPPFAIGAVVVLDGPAASIEEIREFLRSRTVAGEPMRQRLVADPVRIRQATWQDVEPDFEHHVREVQLGPEAEQAELERAVGDLMRQRLDRDRPLWDYTVFTGLAAGQWAVVSRVHHTVADGQGALLLTGKLIDVDPQGTTSLTQALQAYLAAAPTDVQEGSGSDSKALLADAAQRGGDLVLRALRTVRSAAATSAALGSAADAVAKQANTLATQLPRSPGALAGVPGEPRVWHTTQVQLSDVKRIRKALGGTVNDIVMTLMSGGYRELLGSWGADPQDQTVRVLVPVSLRRPGNLESNNQVSGLLVVLPLAGDTVSRYTDIRAHLDAVKDLGTAPLAAPVYEAIDRTVPAFVQTFAISSLSGKVGSAFTETLVTNVPGPQFPVYLAGRRARTMAPIIPLGEPLRLNTGVVSYDGVLHFGFSGGEGIGEGVHLVSQGVQSALVDLLAAADAAGQD